MEADVHHRKKSRNVKESFAHRRRGQCFFSLFLISHFSCLYKNVHHSYQSLLKVLQFDFFLEGKQEAQSNSLTSHQQKVLPPSTPFEVNSSDFPELGDDPSHCPTNTLVRSHSSQSHTAVRGFAASNSKVSSPSRS